MHKLILWNCKKNCHAVKHTISGHRYFSYGTLFKICHTIPPQSTCWYIDSNFIISQKIRNSTEFVHNLFGFTRSGHNYPCSLLPHLTLEFLLFVFILVLPLFSLLYFCRCFCIILNQSGNFKILIMLVSLCISSQMFLVFQLLLITGFRCGFLINVQPLQWIHYLFKTTYFFTKINQSKAVTKLKIHLNTLFPFFILLSRFTSFFNPTLVPYPFLKPKGILLMNASIIDYISLFIFFSQNRLMKHK